MALDLIPEPKKLTRAAGQFEMPRVVAMGIEDHALHNAARVAQQFLPRSSVNISTRGVRDALALSYDRRLKPGGYRLRIARTGVTIGGVDAIAVMHGVQTLRQIVEQCGSDLPILTINDWPDFEDRGVYYDVCRGRVPKLERLFELADQLARYKINHLQLYIEHTFAFRGHPKIGTGASPLTAEDILELDAYCTDLGIELVPSLATFGHMASMLKWPEYHDMSEDWGIGKYIAPGSDKLNGAHLRGWTLSPANPKIYDFLDSLFAEFLPLFRSKRFNICCDETWDLGMGQTYELCEKKGKGVVYLDHIKKVRRLSKKYGKNAMFWGDIIRQYPELIKEIPKDVTVLDWGYAYDHPTARISDFKKAGLPFHACSGTSGWVTLFNRVPEAVANIASFAAAGYKNGAQGLLNTDWGDGGHYNFMEYSWHGFLFGAEQGWNTRADQKSFNRRFARLFFGCDDKAFVDAIVALGDISELGGYRYQSVWRHVFFATMDDAVLRLAEPRDFLVSKHFKIRVARMRFDSKLGRDTVKRLQGVRKEFERIAKKNDADPLGVLSYWIFAVDTLIHAARKLSYLGPGGRDTAARRQELKREMTGLMRRFERLWMARNRRSEIRITLGYYKKALRSL
ncbi:MAG: family 20 glycosylhydrolase [Verrucomicrobia bacterium]|nr:family 20 glycosylhydrolase [Verrucomicrobiota bacterium]